MTVPLLWGRPAPVLLPVPFRCSLARLLPLARPWPGKANRVATAGRRLGRQQSGLLAAASAREAFRWAGGLIQACLPGRSCALRPPGQVRVAQ